MFRLNLFQSPVFPWRPWIFSNFLFSKNITSIKFGCGFPMTSLYFPDSLLFTANNTLMEFFQRLWQVFPSIPSNNADSDAYQYVVFYTWLTYTNRNLGKPLFFKLKKSLHDESLLFWDQLSSSTNVQITWENKKCFNVDIAT